MTPKNLKWFQWILHEMAMVVIEQDAQWTPVDYDDDDMMNASFVFMSILWNKMFKKANLDNKTIDEMKIIAENSGTQIHQLILKCTWLDTKNHKYKQ